MTPTTKNVVDCRRGMAAVLAIVGPIGGPHPGTTEAAPAASADEIVVRMQPGASVDSLRGELATRGLTLRGRIPHTNVVSVATNGRDAAAAIRSLGDAATVVDASPNYIRRAIEVPNDPYVGSSRPYLDAIRLTQAWDLSHGAGDVTIAVVDTGVSPVADLADRLLPGHNFVQDDDVSFDSEPAPDPGDTRDTSAVGHGTLVAGIAAAMTNNGVGIAGVAWDARVLPVKVLNYYGAGDDFLIGKGIVWAADNGADIINLSLGGAAERGGLCESVKYATSRGALVVAAAGNGEDRAAMYPAACPGAFAVTATDSNGDFTYFSNYGRWVDLAAPGVQITPHGTTAVTSPRTEPHSRRPSSRVSQPWCGAASRLGPRPDRGEARGDGAGPRPRRQGLLLRTRTARRLRCARRACASACHARSRHARAERRRRRRDSTPQPDARNDRSRRRRRLVYGAGSQAGLGCVPSRWAAPTTPTPRGTSIPFWRSTTVTSDCSRQRMRAVTERASASRTGTRGRSLLPPRGQPRGRGEPGKLLGGSADAAFALTRGLPLTRSKRRRHEV